ncbi:hypothetical protein NQ317_013613 [Molorchus minor]|uniref:RRM domain-containing protein n=1 Tax=Molorchus minor TaxID=1323400 RepID=A0ABQ9J420_9CUCU|nr:hypothetical protein NQ317_013613 [Molorchus minor]
MKGNRDSTSVKTSHRMEKKPKIKLTLFTVKLRVSYHTIPRKRILSSSVKPLTASFKLFEYQEIYMALAYTEDFIKGKRVSVIKFTNESPKESENNVNGVNSKWKTQEKALVNEESIAESGRIFIRNLAYTTTEEDIEKLFSKYGLLTEINLPVDSSTRKMKGFGVVTFLMPEHAVKAYSELDGSILHGRMVHLLPGKNKDVTDDNLDEKSQARSAHNWNSLFLGHDAVAEVIADTYGTSKEAVVGPEGQGSAAVRLALGETQIVAQTKKYLEEEGVILDAFNNAGTKRSKTIILVKNLPSRTEAKEIREIFEKHGEIGRIILPPSGITEASEARKAFTKLAYSKFKNVPLYLEWAPENSLDPTKIKPKPDIKENIEEEQKEIQDDTKEEENEDDEDPEADTTLFVKNLNFKTTDDALRKHFESCGKIHYANVATKKDKNDPKNLLSMGYGFVQFKHKSSADKALKTFQQSVLDGKSLELKRSERTLKGQAEAPRKATKKNKTNRNVPFQAKKNEIYELFSTFGEIKALRLPKKMAAGSDSHRGFAFVDYAVASDAKTAFEALSQSTHLYGRRLVLEWASNEEAVDEIRKRTADHFKPTEDIKSKKSVFSIE